MREALAGLPHFYFPVRRTICQRESILYILCIDMTETAVSCKTGTELL